MYRPLNPDLYPYSISLGRSNPRPPLFILHIYRSALYLSVAFTTGRHDTGQASIAQGLRAHRVCSALV